VDRPYSLGTRWGLPASTAGASVFDGLTELDDQEDGKVFKVKRRRRKGAARKAVEKAHRAARKR